MKKINLLKWTKKYKWLNGSVKKSNFDDAQRINPQELESKIKEIEKIEFNHQILIKFIMSLSIMTRRDGFLSIEKYLDDENLHPMLKTGLQLYLMGAKPDEIQKSMEAQKRQIEFEFEKYLDIIEEGVISMHEIAFKQENPSIKFNKLKTLL